MWNLWEEQDTEQQDTLVEQLHKAKKKTRTRLSNILVTKVALVDSPASGQRFCIAKRYDADEDEKKELLAIIKMMTEEQFDSFFAELSPSDQQDVYEILTEAEREEAVQKQSLVKKVLAMSPAQYQTYLNGLTPEQEADLAGVLEEHIQKRELLQLIKQMDEAQVEHFFSMLDDDGLHKVVTLLDEAAQG